MGARRHPVRVEPSPIAGMLRRLQTSGGWTVGLDDGLKGRVIGRLAKIIEADDVSPAVQVAAASCLMKASQVENETINTMMKMIETTELTDRLANIEKQLAEAGTAKVDYIDIDVLGLGDDSLGLMEDDEPVVNPMAETFRIRADDDF